MTFITLILYGLLSAAFALIIEILANVIFFASPTAVFAISGAFSPALFLPLFILAGIEELSKYIFLSQYAKRVTALLPFPVKKSLLGGVGFGAGFAILETALARYNAMPFSFWPFFGAAGLHIITGIAFAVFLFSASQTNFKRLTLLALAIFLHMLYNVFVFSL